VVDYLQACYGDVKGEGKSLENLRLLNFFKLRKQIKNKNLMNTAEILHPKLAKTMIGVQNSGAQGITLNILPPGQGFSHCGPYYLY